MSTVPISVQDPWHFETESGNLDPNNGLRIRIQILLFSPVTFEITYCRLHLQQSPKSKDNRSLRSHRTVSVADPGCLSRIPDPDFYPSRIPDPGYKNSSKREGWKKLVVIPFFVAIISQNWKLFYFWNAEEKNFGQFSKNYRTLYPKIVTKLSKIWVWDPGSEIRDPEKTFSGSRIQGSKRHRIPDPICNTGWNQGFSRFFCWLMEESGPDPDPRR